MRTVTFPLVVLLSLPALAAQEQSARTITVSGDAVVNVVPDEVIVSLGVETTHHELELARAANDEASGRLIKALKDLKIDAKHIQTANIDVEPRYKNYAFPSQGIDGYYVRRMYTVTLKDVRAFEDVIDAALRNGANRILSFEFRTSELRKHRDLARKLAINAAREKAVAMAAELKCRVGQPRSISETSGGMPFYGGWRSAWYRGMYGAYGAYGQNVAQNVPGGAADSGGAATPLGQISITAQVNVTFDLETGE